MNKSIRRSLLCAWLLLTTLTVTKLWLTFPDAIPRLSESFWIRLVELSGSQDGEDLETLEMLVAFALSFCVMIALDLHRAVDLALDQVKPGQIIGPKRSGDDAILKRSMHRLFQQKSRISNLDSTT